MTATPAQPPLSTSLLAESLAFPFEPPAGAKRLLFGSLLSVAALIVPILPVLFTTGYAARMVRRVVQQGEAAHMPAWDDWESLLADGLRVWGVSLVYNLPGVILMLGAFVLFATQSIFITTGSSGQSGANWEAAAAVSALAMVVLFTAGLLLSTIASLMTPAAMVHTAVQRSFAAGFDVPAWWRILRANLSGFVLAYLATLAAGLVIVLAVQIVSLPLFFCPPLPALLLTAVGFYLLLVRFALLAQAYRLALMRLAQPGPG